MVYHAASFSTRFTTAMLELNPLYNQIKDLEARSAALRGYL